MTEEAMKLCSLAWGSQDGYVCLAVRDPKRNKDEPGYWEDHWYKWPSDSHKIESALDVATRMKRDVYFAPGVFTTDEKGKPKRSKSTLLNTDTLWSDLDDVNPRELPEDLTPSAWWKTSPGHWQAIWKLPMATPAGLQQLANQKLTYTIGADKGGWDAGQVLRVPNTVNHKKEYRDDPPTVTLEKLNGRRLSIDALSEILLQEVPDAGQRTTTTEATGTELPTAAATLRLKRVSPRVRRLLSTPAHRVHIGERSERLWELECALAEAGWTAPEIVGAVRPSAWNKFAGRTDELNRLFTEAEKALTHVKQGPPPDLSRAVMADATAEGDDDELPRPVTWGQFDEDHKPIRWLVQDVWGEAEVGFISGAPKSYKSWFALDLAVSVATGLPFLGKYNSRPRRTLLVQEEDPRSVLQDRLVKVAGRKGLVGAEVVSRTRISMRYDLPDDLFIISNQGLTLTNEDHLEEMEQFIKLNNVGFVIMDPLFMMAEGLDEFKAFEMMAGVLKPLKRLRARTGVALCLVHHHTKNSQAQDARAMYGSVALWAWEEAALHINVASPGRIVVDRFSKHSKLMPLTVTVGDTSAGWNPDVHEGIVSNVEMLDYLGQFPEGVTVEEAAATTGLTKDTATRELKKLESEGKVTRRPGPATGKRGRRPTLWALA